MGKLRGKQVKCPMCGKIQYTEGSIFFVCCSKTHPIDHNLFEYAEQSEDVLPVDNSVPFPRVVIPPNDVASEGSQTTISRKVEFTGGSGFMTEDEDEYECPCGATFDSPVKFCPECGKELEW